MQFRALALVRVGLTILLEVLNTAGTTAAADGEGAGAGVRVVLSLVALHKDAAAGQLEALAQHQHHVSSTRDTHARARAGAGACNAPMRLPPIPILLSMGTNNAATCAVVSAVHRLACMCVTPTQAQAAASAAPPPPPTPAPTPASAPAAVAVRLDRYLLSEVCTALALALTNGLRLNLHGLLRPRFERS